MTLVAGSYAAAAWPKSHSAGLIAAPFAWTDTLSWCEQKTDGCSSKDLAPIAHRAPLSPKPYPAKVREALEEGNTERARAFSAELLKRDPRSVVARLVLAEAALGEEDAAAFADLYIPLFDIRRSEAATYASLLAALSENTAVYREVADVLKFEPYWGPRYLQEVSGMGLASPAELTGLYTYFPQAQGTLLSRLVRAGHWDLAYIAFTEFVAAEPQATRLPLTSPFNADLAETGAPRPFNWALWSRSAEFLEEGGVYVYYEGRKREGLLSQSFPLSPGQYELETRLSGQASEEGGWFRWQLRCAATNSELATSDIRTLSAAPGTARFAFSFEDAACSFVTLTLEGIPGTFPQPGRIEITGVRVLAVRGDGPVD